MYGWNTSINTILVEITWRIVWKVVSQTLSSFLIRCFGDIYVPNVEDSVEPALELFHSVAGCFGHYAGLSGEIVDVVVHGFQDSLSNLIAEFLIAIMVFRA